MPKNALLGLENNYTLLLKIGPVFIGPTSVLLNVVLTSVKMDLYSSKTSTLGTPRGESSGSLIPTRGKQIAQVFWAAFFGLPQRFGLIPLFGDPQSRRGGVSIRTIEKFYRRILPTLLDSIGQYAIFQQDNAPVPTTRLIQGH